MSAQDKGIGCGGALAIVAALIVLMGLMGAGSDQISHDCEGIATCIKEEGK